MLMAEMCFKSLLEMQKHKNELLKKILKPKCTTVQQSGVKPLTLQGVWTLSSIVQDEFSILLCSNNCCCCCCCCKTLVFLREIIGSSINLNSPDQGIEPQASSPLCYSASIVENHYCCELCCTTSALAI